VRRESGPDGEPGPRREVGLDRDSSGQRELLLAAAAEVIAERGIADVSVALVVARARVSKRTFYASFTNLDECAHAILESVCDCLCALVSHGFAEHDTWLAGMRAALAGILGFFDSQPALARVFIVETLGAGPSLREHRERVIEAIRLLMLAGLDREVTHTSPLEPEGVLASVIGIIHTRLLAREPEPLIQILGPLMGIIVAPFSTRTQTVEEIEKGNALARELLQASIATVNDSAREHATAVNIPELLRTARAHRLRLCLLYVARQARQGFTPSNQDIGDAIGVPHRGHTSMLLARLAAAGLLVKHPGAPGHPNAWSPSTTGERVAAALTQTHHAPPGVQSAAPHAYPY
jgi:AcrR family transcriptional regulator